MRLKSIGIVGVGHMGSAIVRGVLRKKVFNPSDIWIYDVDFKKAERLARELKVKWAKHPKEIAVRTDLILLAVKPQNLPETAISLKAHFRKDPSVITILAGVSMGTVKKHFSQKASVVRAMPNLGATVGESFTALTGDRALLPVARRIFESCGEVLILPESRFHAITALSGSGPAYYFFLMELAMIEAKRWGLSEEQAILLAKQTAKGAALLATHSPHKPSELRGEVTSKGGTTEAALKVLIKKRFPQIFSQAIMAAVKQGEKLGKAVS